MGRKKSKERCQQASLRNTRPATTNELCFHCFNATTNGCSWARSFQLVEGCEAEERVINCGTGHYTTYHIKECPEFAPDRDYGGDYHICYDGYVNLITAFARQCADEYRKAKSALSEAMQDGKYEEVCMAKDRFDSIRTYMEGYEKECEQISVRCEISLIHNMKEEDLKKLYEDEVLNDPNKNSKDKRIKLANSQRKAAIISALYPCKKCAYKGGQFSKICQSCGFEHSKWTPMTPYQEKHDANKSEY